jgi:hypothetical protein
LAAHSNLSVQAAESVPAERAPVDEQSDIRRQLEIQRCRVEWDMAEQRSRTLRLCALGILVIAIAMAVLVLIANDY